MITNGIEERPHFNLLTRELDELVAQSWDSANALLVVAKELLHRDRKTAERLRERIISRVTEILENQHGFLWPSTAAPLGPGHLDPDVFRHDRSPLNAMGYSVGLEGPTDENRHAILDAAYQGVIPPVNSAEYMSRWGNAKTSSRLERMANLIASNVRNKKRQGDPAFQLAIDEWERDLAYLKKAYYDGHYDSGLKFFPWPDTTL